MHTGGPVTENTHAALSDQSNAEICLAHGGGEVKGAGG